MKATNMKNLFDDNERRKQSRLEKLGCNDPKCCICGNADWRVLELHHVAAIGRDVATVIIICANHHRILTDGQKDHPSFDPSAEPFLDKVGHFLLGMADMLKLIVEKLYEFGHGLIERAKPQAVPEVVS